MHLLILGWTVVFLYYQDVLKASWKKPSVDPDLAARVLTGIRKINTQFYCHITRLQK